MPMIAPSSSESLDLTSNQSYRLMTASLSMNKSHQHQQVSHVKTVAGRVETGVECLRFSSQHLNFFPAKLSREFFENFHEISI
jgi:hypothetical protein